MSWVQSVFDPQSRDAAAIAELMWMLIVTMSGAFLLTMVLSALALWVRPAWLGKHGTIVVAGVAFPTVVLLAIPVYTMRLAGATGQPPQLRIEVVGHQWWWQVRYLRPDGSFDFETANEIRLPVGEAAELALASGDVLLSFWVPDLGGKLDIVPGRVNRMRLAADRAGLYRGQCAEYCGGPHAQMALYVVVAPAEEFERWREGQRRPASATHPLFAARCAVCHTVRGTTAEGRLGPDLTHVGSRVSIGAGILPNESRALSDWIAASQHIKLGNLMPSFPMLSADKLRALASYLESLK